MGAVAVPQLQEGRPRRRRLARRFFLAFRGLPPVEYAEILDRCCNGYGWEKAVVDAAPNWSAIAKWERNRRIALEEGRPYRSAVVRFPGNGRR